MRYPCCFCLPVIRAARQCHSSRCIVAISHRCMLIGGDAAQPASPARPARQQIISNATETHKTQASAEGFCHPTRRDRIERSASLRQSMECQKSDPTFSRHHRSDSECVVADERAFVQGCMRCGAVEGIYRLAAFGNRIKHIAQYTHTQRTRTHTHTHTYMCIRAAWVLLTAVGNSNPHTNTRMVLCTHHNIYICSPY